MSKFRASYTVLSNWASGIPERQDIAVMQYFHIPTEVTQYMKDGKEYHKKFEDYTVMTGRHQDCFGGMELRSPMCEMKLVVDLDEWLELVGVIDLLYEWKKGRYVIEDYKVGHKTANSYLGSPQLGIYALLCQLSSIPVEQIRVRGYNQYLDKASTAYVWNTKELRENALDWVITWASDMHSFLQANDVYADPYGYLGIQP